jgi:hypothetical protein
VDELPTIVKEVINDLGLPVVHEIAGETGGLDLPVTADIARGWEMNKENTRGIIAIVSVLGIIGIASGMFYYKVPPESKDYFLIVLTFLVAKIGTVYDYFYGSSQGSVDKTDIIGNLTAPTAGTITTTTKTDTVKTP